MIGRLLGVDPGDKRIGIALSDETGIIASPLEILSHVSRAVDAARIAEIAREKGAVRIIVGQAMDENGKPNPQGRKAERLADALRMQSDLPVELWDESYSTRTIQSAYIEMGVSRKRRREHHDDMAAVVILQSYLDQHIEK